MKDIIFSLICIAGALVVGFVANRLNRKIFQRQKTSTRNAVIAFMASLLGLVIGLFIVPSTLIPDNQYLLIVVAIGATLGFGFIELFFIKALIKNKFENYLLDGAPFPFVSFGFACSLLLKPHM